MGMFSFLSDAGKKLMGKGDDGAAIKKEIEDSFAELPVAGLVVKDSADPRSGTPIILHPRGQPDHLHPDASM